MSSPEKTSPARPSTRPPTWRPSGFAPVTDEPAPAEAPAPAPDDPLIGTMIEGRYTLLERIGSGGMAVVYRAQEQGLFQREVAIKLLSKESSADVTITQRFLKEAQAIVKIEHRNVVSLYHAARTARGQLYLVMELLRGNTLAGELAALRARGAVFSWERLAPLVVQICGALHAAHRRQILHRDVKPGNCFLLCDESDGSEYVKVLDFGIAKYQAVPIGDVGADPETPLTQEGRALGTPHYVAPEVIDPDPALPVDGRVDQFALGVMMYELLTGTKPFPEKSIVRILDKTAHEDPQPPRERAPERGISAAVEAIVLRAMARDPRSRYASMLELSEAVRATLVSPPPPLRSGVFRPDDGSSARGVIVEVSAAVGGDMGREPTLPASGPKVLVGGSLVGRTPKTEPNPTVDDATPLSQEVIPRPGPQPSVPVNEAPRPSVWLYLGTVVMLLGVFAVVGLVIAEAVKPASETPPSTPAAPPSVPPPRSDAAPRVEAPRVEPETRPPPEAKLEVGATPAGASEAPAALGNADAERLERIERSRAQVRRLTTDARVIRCLMDGRIAGGVRLAIELELDATGNVLRAGASGRGRKPVPERVKDCVAERVGQIDFPPGSDPRLVVEAEMVFP